MFGLTRGRLIAVLLAIVAGVGIGAGTRIFTSDSARQLVSSGIGGPFKLTDQNGQPRSDADFRGKLMLVEFGYTFCPDVCPLGLQLFADVLDGLGPDADKVQAVFITVDPKRDTPEKLKMYLSAFDGLSTSRPGFIGLTGTDEEIDQAADAYEVYYMAHLDGRFGGEEGYSVDHSGNVYLMSPEGKFVSYYSQGISPDELAADLMMKIPG